MTFNPYTRLIATLLAVEDCTPNTVEAVVEAADEQAKDAVARYALAKSIAPAESPRVRIGTRRNGEDLELWINGDLATTVDDVAEVRRVIYAIAQALRVDIEEF